ncbi:MAG: hypothetical protein IJC30_04645, partial [Alphaproteobacteria bacterium]|nr:hypothetical protein [Alphaproteobacteria bacterium]
VLVKNYVDNIGACGEVCCEMKEDWYTPSHTNEFGEWPEMYELGYHVVGAVNGECCGAYSSIRDIGVWLLSRYHININGGIPYCAYTIENVMIGGYSHYPDSQTHVWLGDYRDEDTKELLGPPYGGYVCKSSIGDPGNGTCEFCEGCSKNGENCSSCEPAEY